MNIDDIAREFVDECVDIDDDLVVRPGWFWKLVLMFWVFS